ncbi:hypothetical protein AAC03nite_38210 [Alicyclobacillus acidoterrestris]|nr:hypothetical protein AAC03nite_38210 [Alicyclobacillus acidoterrestris]
MRYCNVQAIMNLEDGLEAIKHGGIPALLNQFLWAAQTPDKHDELTNKAIIDVERALDILKVVGAEAFAVYFILESQSKPITLTQISSQLGLPLSTVTHAAKRLGLYMLDISDDT